MTWSLAFALTLAVEVPLGLLLVRHDGRARVAMVVTAGSALSHPLLCFVLVRRLPGGFLARVLIGELIVVAIEGVVLAVGLRLPPGRALALSATLNAASYLVGVAWFNAPA
ncbi:MAG: hypothetical protein JNK64_26475 [Myxococcales bacterium]|nr:hypothetical protein [Myxococcales bacterium]